MLFKLLWELYSDYIDNYKKYHKEFFVLNFRKVEKKGTKGSIGVYICTFVK